KRPRLIDIFCLPPFFLPTYFVSNFSMVFYSVILMIVIFGPRLFQAASARFIYRFWGFSFAASAIYLSSYSIIYRTTFMTAAVTFPFIWAVGAVFLYNCNHNANFEKHSWHSLAIYSLLLTQLIPIIPMGPGLFNFWLLLFTFSYGFLSVIPVLAIFLTGILIGILNRSIGKVAAIFTLALFSAYYVLDAFVFLKNGQRLDYHAINWVIGLNSFSSIFETALTLLTWQNFAGLILAPFAAFMIFQFSNGNYGRRFADKTGYSSALLLLISMVTFVGLRIATMPINILGDPIRNLIVSVPHFQSFFESKPDPITLHDELAKTGFNMTMATREFLCSPMKEKKPANLIFILLESTGNQYLSLFGAKDSTMPLLEKHKDRIETFPCYFSTFPESANADFSIFTSLMTSTLHILRHKPWYRGNTLIEVLKAAGYDCSLFFSEHLGDTGKVSFFMPRGADRVYDAGTMPGMKKEDGWIWGVKEHFVVDRIIDQLNRQKGSEKPFFIFYRTIFPHAPFDRIDANAPKVFSESDFLEGKSVGRFKNSLLYMDRQLDRLIRALDEAGLRENTWIAVSSDHATMLGEHGMHGHGWNLAPYLTNVPFFIIHPEAHGFKVNETPGSHIDLLPTLLNLINVKPAVPLFIQGRDLLSPESKKSNPKIFLSSFEHLVLIENGLYFWHLAPIRQNQVYKISINEGRVRFSKVPANSELKIDEKVREMKKIAHLQRFLLMNYEFYAETFIELANQQK
ncbi:MAG: LTA synthase family protein, partial [Candidatus Riflebacteria bacterium]